MGQEEWSGKEAVLNEKRHRKEKEVDNHKRPSPTGIG